MGQDVDEALKALTLTRARLDRDIDALVQRMPEPAVIAARAKTYGIAAGGAAVTVGALAARQRSRSRERARRTEARINAEELARAFSPHPPADTGRSRGGLAVLAAALVAGAAFLLRVRADR